MSRRGMRESPHFAKRDEKKGSLAPLLHKEIAPHTLILGTQPSDNSLQHGCYYMTNANAFWHIAGDALGFRRGFHIDNRTEAVDFIREHLLHKDGPLFTYKEAVDLLTSRGYAVWDVLIASERKGSLDSSIKHAVPGNISLFLERNPTIRKICFASGASSAKFFLRSHSSYLKENKDRFAPHPDPISQAVFGTMIKGKTHSHTIQLCVMESVSPAANPRQTWSAEAQIRKGFSDHWTRRPAALYPFKRDQWFRVCYPKESAVIAAPPFGSLPSHFRSVSIDPLSTNPITPLGKTNKRSATNALRNDDESYDAPGLVTPTTESDILMSTPSTLRNNMHRLPSLEAIPSVQATPTTTKKRRR